jgi:hypothetical protein
MSLVIERFLICDHCHENYGVDVRSNTAALHRKSAKKAGWKRGGGGKDFCPDCVKVLTKIPF